jgi:small subunit ribosomal protein S21
MLPGSQAGRCNSTKGLVFGREMSKIFALFCPMPSAWDFGLYIHSKPTPNQHSMSIKVQVRSNESLEAALRRFKRQCNSSGVFRLAKANTWHEKRSDERRRERRERIRTILRAQRKHQARVRRG